VEITNSHRLLEVFVKVEHFLFDVVDVTSDHQLKIEE